MGTEPILANKMNLVKITQLSSIDFYSAHIRLK